MLRNRSRAVSSNKQAALMAPDHSTSHHSTQTQSDTTVPTSSFLSSPKFKGFITQLFPAGNEAVVISPSSVLDDSTRININPFRRRDRKNDHLITSPRETFSPTKQYPWKKSDSRDRDNIIGLKIIDTLDDDKVIIGEKSPTNKPCNKKVLRVQIPPLSFSPNGSPKSPAGFGIKSTHNSSQESGSGSSGSFRNQRQKLSASEMEQSEEYTCVTRHDGPNPRKTHIFDNCIMESYCSLSRDRNQQGSESTEERYFLSFCHTCKRSIKQTEDIYIYRGEKAFCSKDCRHREMVADGAENSEFYS